METTDTPTAFTPEQIADFLTIRADQYDNTVQAYFDDIAKAVAHCKKNGNTNFYMGFIAQQALQMVKASERAQELRDRARDIRGIR